MLDADVKGRAEIALLKAKLGIIPGEMRKDLAAGTRKALRPLKKEISAAALAYLPKRGGYAPLMARAVKVATRVSASSEIRAYVTVSAKGKVEERDVRRVNRGELRHKLFGKTHYINKFGERKSGWFTTTVRRGFVDDPVQEAGKRVASEAKSVVDKIADELERE